MADVIKEERRTHNNLKAARHA